MKLYDNSTYDDLVRYAALGLPPGSFAAALLLGDLELAYQRAHPLLLPRARRPVGFVADTFEFDPAGAESDADVVANMMQLVEERFPPIMRGSREIIQRWVAHQGFKGASDETKVLFLVFCDGRLLERVKRLVEA